MSEPVIIYHGGCMDGFGSAYAAYVHFVLKQNQQPEFIAAAHSDEPANVKGKQVYLLDFAYKRSAMEALCQQALKVTVLDHHISAEKDLAGLDQQFSNVNLQFDMSRSGAAITWDYFHRKELPLLLQCVQDRDLWLNQVADSEHVSAALMSYPFSFDRWHEWATDEEKLKGLIHEGRAINRYRYEMVSQHIKRSVMGNISGYKVPVVNCPRAIVSELVGQLAKGYPFAAGYMDTGTRRTWSLRSTAEGLDVSVIASELGGGGHPRAAGFITTLPENMLQVP